MTTKKRSKPVRPRPYVYIVWADYDCSYTTTTRAKAEAIAANIEPPFDGCKIVKYTREVKRRKGR